MTGFLFLFDAYLPGWQKVPSLVITTSGKLNFFFFCATCFSCLAQCRVTNLRTNAYEAGFVGIHDLCRGPFYVDRSLSLACTMHFFFLFFDSSSSCFNLFFRKALRHQVRMSKLFSRKCQRSALKCVGDLSSWQCKLAFYWWLIWTRPWELNRYFISV